MEAEERSEETIVGILRHSRNDAMLLGRPTESRLFTFGTSTVKSV